MRIKFFLAVTSIILLPISSFGESETWLKRQNISMVRRQAAGFDENAIRELGNRGDAESVQFLKQLAAKVDIRKIDIANENTATAAKHYDRMATKDRLWPNRSACFAARAALTKMKVADHFGDFIVELSTTNGAWKWEMVKDLGYIGDARAIKYIGPLLFSKTCVNQNPYTACNALSEVATVSMGQILQPQFMDVMKTNPNRENYFPKEWRQWWIEHKTEYGDASTSSSDIASNDSQAVILRNTNATAAVKAAADEGSADIALRWIQVQLPSANGKTSNVGVVLALAPQSGPLWWKYKVLASSETSDELSEFSDEYKLYLTTSALLAFQLIGNRVVVSVGSVRYQSADAALSGVIPTIQKNLTNGSSTQVLQTRSTDLWKVLGQGFFMSGGKVGSGTIASVTRKDEQWILFLAGPNKDKAVLILSSDYKVVSASMNGKAVYP